jgi:hypothetical protein
MKYIAVFLAALFAAGAAHAADLRDPIAKIDQLAAGNAPFTGFYAGIEAGGQWTNLNFADTFDGIGADGGIAGAFAGYDFALAPRFRAGVYVNGGFSNVNTEIGGFDLLSQDDYIGAGARLCVLVSNSSQICGKAGYEWQNWSSDLISADVDVGQIVLGGQLETTLAEHSSFHITADYLKPNNVEIGGTDVTDAVKKSESLRVLAGVAYRH